MLRYSTGRASAFGRASALPNQRGRGVSNSATSRGKNVLERLEAAGVAAQRDDGHTVAGERLRVHQWVEGGRGADQLAERHPVSLGRRQQQLQPWFAVPGLQPGQGADRYAGGLRHGRQRGSVAAPHLAQPRPDRGRHGIEAVARPLAVHSSTVPTFCGFRKELCQSGG